MATTPFSAKVPRRVTYPHPKGATCPPRSCTVVPAACGFHPGGACTVAMRNEAGSSMSMPVTAVASAVTPTGTATGVPTATRAGVAQPWASADGGTRAMATTDHADARMGAVRRTLVTVATLLAWSAVAVPSPAAAHGGAGPEATNYRTRLLAVEPRVAGLTVQVIEAGSRIEVRNESDVEVVVVGYEDEPYLRIGPDGVFENTRSRATYVNVARTQDDIVLPEGIDPAAPPEWRKASDEPVARWHDHRIHWMAENDPPAVRRDRGRTHVVIPTWVIPLRMGDRVVEARGDLAWVPGPSPAPWLLGAVGLLAVVAAFGLGGGRFVAVAAVLMVLFGTDVAHAVGIGFASAGSVGQRILLSVGSGLFALVGWIAAVWGARLLLQRRREGFFFAVAAGVLVALFGGLAELPDLTKSQVPFAWGAGASRLFVVLALGLGLGAVGAAWLSLRRVPPEEPVLDVEDE